MKSHATRLSTVVATALLTLLPSVRGQTTPTFKTLHDLTGNNGGSVHPYAALLVGRDGNLYGTSRGDVTGDNGSIFRLSADGRAFTTLHEFTGTGGEGADPAAALIQGSDGAFYGTTLQGGTEEGLGTIYRLSADGQTLTTLHRFTGTGGEGAGPFSALIQGSDGAFYGTTEFGGTSNSRGTVYRLSADGLTFTTLHAFTGTDGEGSDPFDVGLLQGRDGAFYGTTGAGGTKRHGTIYRITADGQSFLTLHSFINANGEGDDPDAALIQGRDGAFYGTTNEGGTSGKGTIYRLSANGRILTTLHQFTGTGGEGSYPHGGLLQGRDGAFYGTTQSDMNNNGTIFRLSGDGKTLTTVHNFTGVRGEGAQPLGALIQDRDGNFYGTTFDGGMGDQGTIFELSFPAPVVTSAPNATATVGLAFSYQITATNDPTSYGVLGLPPGLHVNAQTGLISGTPTSSGRKALLVEATNVGGTGDLKLALTIYAQAPPDITSPTSANAMEGKAFSFQISATNGPTSFGVLGLPPGLKVDGKAGIISGTPTTSGTKKLTLKATNAYGTGMATLTLVISQAAPERERGDD